MGLLPKKTESYEELEDRRDYLAVQSEVVSKEAELAEKNAIIKELKAKYGSNWKNILGLKGLLNLQTLRSVLGGMNRGLRSMSGATHNPNLNPLPPRNLRR